MFNEINNIIDVKSGDSLSGWFIGISESNNDGTFFIHHFLSHCLKSSLPVCFVALSQSFGHYNSVSQKFGTNLIPLKDSKKLEFIEGLKIVGNLCLTNFDKGDNSVNLNNSQAVVNSLLQSISTSYEELKATHFVGPTIIIDNISCLISIGLTVKDVIGFCHYLHELTQRSKSGSGKGCLIIYSNNGKYDGDDQLKMLWNWICHNSSVNIEVTGLASGYCKDVHGEILVKKRPLLTKPQTERRMQYKLSDKSITMFAPGMSSAVL